MTTRRLPEGLRGPARPVRGACESYAMAVLSGMIMQRITGDQCRILKEEDRYYLVRIDPSGKKVWP